jgi:hypothetical protein
MKQHLIALVTLSLLGLNLPLMAQETKSQGDISSNITYGLNSTKNDLSQSPSLIARDELGQWYFWVKNNSSGSIAQILVSERGSTWSYFEDSNIEPGQKLKLIWYKSTDNQSCNQWIKAVFDDGSESRPAKFNFCQDLDNPIVFSD